MVTLWSVYDTADRAQITRLVGTLISVIGVFLASPAGTASAVTSAARTLTSWRRAPRSQVYVAGGLAAMAASAAMGAAGVVRGPRQFTTDERLDLLVQRVDGVEDRVSDLAKRHTEEVAALKADLAEATRLHEEDVARLEARLAEQEAETAKMDARALPVILFGVLLSAADGALASLPVWLWAGLTALVASLCLWMAFRVYRAHHRRASNREAAAAPGAEGVG